MPCSKGDVVAFPREMSSEPRRFVTVSQPSKGALRTDRLLFKTIMRERAATFIVGRGELPGRSLRGSLRTFVTEVLIRNAASCIAPERHSAQAAPRDGALRRAHLAFRYAATETLSSASPSGPGKPSAILRGELNAKISVPPLPIAAKRSTRARGGPPCVY